MDDFVGHRLQLATQMDQIGLDHDKLTQDLLENSRDHPLIFDVKQWQLDEPSSMAIENDQEKPPLQMIKIKQNRDLTGETAVSRSVWWRW